MTITVRELDRVRDRRGVEAIDTAFETSTIFDVVAAARAIELVERDARGAADQALLDRRGVRRLGALGPRLGRRRRTAAMRGFATVEYEAWHQRLILWFLYIAPAWRRRGVGRALLERVEAHGREVGATHVWLETSNVNVPGVAAYKRLGYALSAPTPCTTARTCRARARCISGQDALIQSGARRTSAPLRARARRAARARWRSAARTAS